MIFTITADPIPINFTVTCDKPDVIFVSQNEPINFTVSVVRDGDKGDKGDKGDQGDKGDKGDKGDQGEALNNTLELVRLEDNKFAGDMDGQGVSTIVNIRNATSNQEAATYSQLLAAVQETKEYTDNKTTDTVRWVAFWDATGGLYPQGFPSSIRRGDEFEANNAIPVLMPDGTEIQKGDVFRARINTPGQISANWSIGQGNTQQSTESVQGTLKIIPTGEIQDENTTNNKDAVTGVKFWLGLSRFKAIAQSISGAWTFTQAVKLSTVGSNQYLKSNGFKEVISTATIPASDVTTDPSREFVSSAQKTKIDSSVFYWIDDAVDRTIQGIGLKTFAYYKIEANSFRVGSKVRIQTQSVKSNGFTTSQITTIYHSTVPSLTAPVPTGITALNSAAAQAVISIDIEFVVKATELVFFLRPTNNIGSVSNTAPVIASIPFNRAIDNYFFIGISPNDNTAIFTQQYFGMFGKY